MPPGPMDPLALSPDPRPHDLIFVVEDDRDVSRLIEHNLRSAGYDVSTFSSGAPVLPSAAILRPSLFLLDVMLPGMSGIDLCRQIRQHEQLSRNPVIFVSARTDEYDRLQAFDVGGDDYITKPFSPRELICRVRNLLRSPIEVFPQQDVLQVGDLEIDVASLSVRVQRRTVQTTVREFRLLEYLARHRGRVFSRNQLLDAVWEEGAFVTPRSIDVFIRRLRRKIEDDPRHPRYLTTLRGVGYRFESPK